MHHRRQRPTWHDQSDQQATHQYQRGIAADGTPNQKQS